MAPCLFAYCLEQKDKLSRTSDDDSDDDCFKEVLIEVPKRSLEETATEPATSAAFHNDVVSSNLLLCYKMHKFVVFNKLHYCMWIWFFRF